MQLYGGGSFINITLLSLSIIIMTMFQLSTVHGARSSEAVVVGVTQPLASVVTLEVHTGPSTAQGDDYR